MKLNKYRQFVKKTQAECAKELEITVVYFSEIERNVNQPGRKLADKIISWSDGMIGYEDLWPKN